MPTRSPSGTVDADGVTRARRLLARERVQGPRLAELYKLLANPMRLKILLALSETQRLCVGDLAQVLDLSIAATSQQLKILRQHGWLRAAAEGRLVYYELTSSGLRDALGVLKDVQGLEVVHFSEVDVVRHPLVARIVKAYAKVETE